MSSADRKITNNASNGLTQLSRLIGKIADGIPKFIANVHCMTYVNNGGDDDSGGDDDGDDDNRDEGYVRYAARVIKL